MKKVGQIFRESLANQVKEGVENNKSTFLMSYAEMPGIEMNNLRKDLINAGAQMCASRNRIARLALKDIKQEDLAEKITGQMVFVWSNEDSVSISKILVKFAKENEKIVVHGGLLDGGFLNEADVKKLSDLPSREVLLSTLLGTIQAPLIRLAGALNAKSRDLLSILKQYGERKAE